MPASSFCSTHSPHPLEKADMWQEASARGLGLPLEGTACLAPRSCLVVVHPLNKPFRESWPWGASRRPLTQATDFTHFHKRMVYWVTQRLSADPQRQRRLQYAVLHHLMFPTPWFIWKMPTGTVPLPDWAWPGSSEPLLHQVSTLAFWFFLAELFIAGTLLALCRERLLYIWSNSSSPTLPAWCLIILVCLCDVWSFWSALSKNPGKLV